VRCQIRPREAAPPAIIFRRSFLASWAGSIRSDRPRTLLLALQGPGALSSAGILLCSDTFVREFGASQRMPSRVRNCRPLHGRPAPGRAACGWSITIDGWAFNSSYPDGPLALGHLRASIPHASPREPARAMKATRNGCPVRSRSRSPISAFLISPPECQVSAVARRVQLLDDARRLMSDLCRSPRASSASPTATRTPTPLATRSSVRCTEAAPALRERRFR